MTLPADFPRPTKHDYRPDPLSLQGDCLVCGRNCDPFGLTTEPAFPEPVDEIPECPDCRHYRHDGRCGVVVNRWPQRSCGCPRRAA